MLKDRGKGARAGKKPISAEVRLAIVKRTAQEKPKHATHWSARMLAEVYKYALDLTVGLRRGGCPTKLVVRRHAAGSIFSLANGKASRKVCIGVLPKHQRP